MSYLRLDNREFETHNYRSAMMTADGKYRYGNGDGAGHALVAQTYGSLVPGPPASIGSLPSHPYSWLGAVRGQLQQPQQPQQPQLQQRPQQPQRLRIRGVNDLMKQIGYPDITDSAKGGIAIWSSSTLRARKYKFLHRVEIIDESVPSLYPVKHFSNVYIWVPIHLTESMLNNVNQMSTDIFYDRGKELLIVRSDSLDTAVAQAALVALYSKGKVSYYDIMNNDMLENYYNGIRRSRTKRALYTVLNNLSKR